MNAERLEQLVRALSLHNVEIDAPDAAAMRRRDAGRNQAALEQSSHLEHMLQPPAHPSGQISPGGPASGYVCHPFPIPPLCRLFCSSVAGPVPIAANSHTCSPTPTVHRAGTTLGSHPSSLTAVAHLMAAATRKVTAKKETVTWMPREWNLTAFSGRWRGKGHLTLSTNHMCWPEPSFLSHLSHGKLRSATNNLKTSATNTASSIRNKLYSFSSTSRQYTFTHTSDVQTNL
jgi:hypothetical protein